jgi:transglutaminase-like putative cysteine protease
MEAMRTLAREGSRYTEPLALAIVGRDDAIDAIDRWTRNHFRYRFELEEVIRTVRFMLDDLARSGSFDGDCDDAATFIAALAVPLGIPVRFSAIRTDADDPDYSHVFAELFDRGDWYPVDPTVPEGTIYVEFGRMIRNV